jgi:hypothetical protein
MRTCETGQCRQPKRLARPIALEYLITVDLKIGRQDEAFISSCCAVCAGRLRVET